jgi:hypothetical protein
MKNVYLIRYFETIENIKKIKKVSLNRGPQLKNAFFVVLFFLLVFNTIILYYSSARGLG